MIRTCQKLLVIAVAALCVLATKKSCHAEEAASQGFTVEDVLQAWQRRAEQVPSAQFTWRRSRSDEHRFSQVEETHRPTEEDAYQCVFRADAVFLRIPGSAPDTFYQVAHRLGGPDLGQARNGELKRTVQRFQESGAEYAPSRELSVHQRLLRATSATEVWLPVPASGNYPKAWRYQPIAGAERTAQLNLWFQPAADTTGQISLLFAQAPLIALQPLSPILGAVLPERCRLAPGTKTMAGRDCLILEETLGNPAHVRAFWVDPQRSFAILRYQAIADFHLAAQLDFDYVPDPAHGWIPQSWTAVEFQASTKTIRSFATTKDVQVEFALSETSLPGELTLSPGTWLVDETTQQQLLISEPGEPQPLVDVVGPPTAAATVSWPRKCAATYADWIRQQADQANFQVVIWLILGALGVVALAALSYWAWISKRAAIELEASAERVR